MLIVEEKNISSPCHMLFYGPFTALPFLFQAEKHLFNLS